MNNNINELTESINRLTEAVNRLNQVIDKIGKGNIPVQPLRARVNLSTRGIRRHGNWI